MSCHVLSYYVKGLCWIWTKRYRSGLLRLRKTLWQTWEHTGFKTLRGGKTRPACSQKYCKRNPRSTFLKFHIRHTRLVTLWRLWNVDTEEKRIFQSYGRRQKSRLFCHRENLAVRSGRDGGPWRWWAAKKNDSRIQTPLPLEFKVITTQKFHKAKGEYLLQDLLNKLDFV